MIHSLFLETTTAASGLSPFLLILVMFGVMYLLIIRPENKKRKQADEMRSNLSLGDEIVTIGGITGKIVQITEDTITFETGEDRVRIQVRKWAISTTAKMEAAEAAQNSGRLFGGKK